MTSDEMTSDEIDAAVMELIATYPKVEHNAGDIARNTGMTVNEANGSLDRLLQAGNVRFVGTLVAGGTAWRQYVYVQPIGTPRLRIATGHDGATILRIDVPEKHRVYINDVLVSGVVATDDTLTTWKQVP